MQNPDIQLTEVQREVHTVILELFQEDGVAPTHKRVKMRIGRDPRTAIRNLKDLGYVGFPYKSGPIKILKDIDGNPVRAILAQTCAALRRTKATP